MEKMRETFEAFKDKNVTVPTVTTAVEENRSLRRRRPVFTIAVAVLLGLLILLGGGYAALQYGMPALRYHSGMDKMEHGQYAEALQIFRRLGDYRDAEALCAEAEKGIAYLEAAEVLLQGDRDAAVELLEQIGDFPHAVELLRQIEVEMLYHRAELNMAEGDYKAAADGFAALGDYRDAREKEQQCRTIYETETAYAKGLKFYREGRWLEAYRTLASIRDADHLDTGEMLDKIVSCAAEYAEEYAQAGERGKTLAFIDLVEEYDAETGSELREQLIEKETFAADQSFYYFDTTHIERFTANTPTGEFASVVLYMLIYGKMEYSLMSNKPVDYDLLLDRAFQACDLMGEIIPGYGSIYNPSVTVGDNYVVFYLNHGQEYSEHERTQHLKLFKTFCEDSVRQLAELGLLSKSMTRRQQAEVIINWVGYYLTYDHSLTTHDVGAAIESRRGVCEAFAALYNRMCNLAGIPTYGQIGLAGPTEDARHIWSFHLDEDGNIFYADATWADPWGLDFGAPGQEVPTVEQFAADYLERCMQQALVEKKVVSDVAIGGGDGSAYVYSVKRWISHVPERSAEEIMGYHAKLTGKAA